MFYISVSNKFFLAVLVATLWAIFSTWVAAGWYIDLATHIGHIPAGLLITFIAIVPGFMNAFMLTSLLLDKRPVPDVPAYYPKLSILIAAYNEEGTILQTLKSIAVQDYNGEIEVIVVNDGSRDSTREIVLSYAIAAPWVRLIDMNVNVGKAAALNTALMQARHPFVVTIDADTYLYKDALMHIVARYLSDPLNTRAVAGTVLARNSRDTWVTKVQEWDYFHGISAIKRIQSLYQGTLVAQGAFSIYDRNTLRQLGGWPDTVGEDIVLTWAFLKAGYRVGHCEDACAFTTVPSSIHAFIGQRRRWARGMIEAFKIHPGVLFKKKLSTFFIWWDAAFPFLDAAFTLGFIPGIILAMFGHFWIVGPMTLAVLPLALIMNFEMYHIGKGMFDKQGLLVRSNRLGFLSYLLFYNLILQPASLLGYFGEFFNVKKNWGTK